MLESRRWTSRVSEMMECEKRDGTCYVEEYAAQKNNGVTSQCHCCFDAEVMYHFSCKQRIISDAEKATCIAREKKLKTRSRPPQSSSVSPDILVAFLSLQELKGPPALQD